MKLLSVNLYFVIYRFDSFYKELVFEWCNKSNLSIKNFFWCDDITEF